MIFFRSFTEQDLQLFRKWLQKDHIREIWQEPEDEKEFRTKFLVELPSRGIKTFIIEQDSAPIGYIQSYHAFQIGGGWWEKEHEGTFGIDLMIGDENKLGRGLGPMILQEFMALLRNQEPGVTSFIIDPDPKNQRAIRAFEKAGFSKEAEIVTPSGPALLMRYQIKSAGS